LTLRSGGSEGMAGQATDNNRGVQTCNDSIRERCQSSAFSFALAILVGHHFSGCSGDSSSVHCKPRLQAPTGARHL